MITKLLEKLKDKKYRDLFVSGQIKTGIPFQIRTMRDREVWTQEELGKRVGLPQSAIARLENPDTAHSPNIKTLLKMASAFDVALIVRFAPFTELAHWVEGVPYEVKGLSPKTLAPLSFAEDVQLYKATTTTPILISGSGNFDAVVASATGTCFVFSAKSFQGKGVDKEGTGKIVKKVAETNPTLLGGSFFVSTPISGLYYAAE